MNIFFELSMSKIAKINQKKKKRAKIHGCWTYCFISLNQIILSHSKIAAQNGHKDVVEFFASKGADINHKNKNGLTSLMIGI